MSNETYTEDLSDIMQCAHERHEVMRILQAWDKAGLPNNFSDSGVKFGLNKHSGNIFLTNEDCQCAMMNGDKLASFYSTPYNGLEGFIEDILSDNNPDDIHEEDVEYIRDIAKMEGVTLPDNWADTEVTG